MFVPVARHCVILHTSCSLYSVVVIVVASTSPDIITGPVHLRVLTISVSELIAMTFETVWYVVMLLMHYLSALDSTHNSSFSAALHVATVGCTMWHQATQKSAAPFCL